MCGSRFCHLSPDKKEFDAFISYATGGTSDSEPSSPVSEDHLALKLFPEVLENKHGYTLCLLERDVAPGGGRPCPKRSDGAKGWSGSRSVPSPLGLAPWKGCELKVPGQWHVHLGGPSS